MASRHGEENVATLFGDVHYFYSPENVKPRHHRFDKGSYVYLFENASQRRCRIEVANQPGTEDQDAFEGYLDQTRVKYSYKQECIISLTVADTVDHTEWHLPTHDPRNEAKYHYKLHSLDIYFWTHKDALQFVNGVRRVLPANQVEVLDEPAPAIQHGMQAVVQNLENVAISDPQYGNIRNSQDSTQIAATASQAAHTASATSSTAPASGQLPLPPPPPPPPPPPAQTQSQAQAQAPATFVPMAYNPAAPAAPETIQHREKTPPPDEDPLNPLAVAVAYDYQGQPFTPGLPPSIGSPGYAPPGMMSPGLPPPPPHPQPGLHRAATMPAQNHPGLPGTYNYGSHGSSPAPSQQTTVHPNATMSPLSSPGLASLGSQSGFSNYTYSPAPQQQQQQQQQPQQVPHGPMDYSIHQQVYIPGASEATKKQQSYVPKQENRGKLEENAARLEKSVSGMLKRFEKKFG